MAIQVEDGYHYVSLDIYNDSPTLLELSSLTEKPLEYAQRPATLLPPRGKTNTIIKIGTLRQKIEGFIGYSPRNRPNDTLYSIYFANPVDGSKNHNIDVMTWDEEHIGKVSNLKARDKNITSAEVHLSKYC